MTNSVIFFLLFGGPAYPADNSFRSGCRLHDAVYLPYGALAVSIFTLLEEISQVMLVNRTLDSLDFICSMTGILLFSLPVIFRFCPAGKAQTMIPTKIHSVYLLYID